MDERVTAHVFLQLALANDRLAKLQAMEKEFPVLSGTSSARLRLSRRITNARSLAQSWAKAYALIETGAFDTGAALKRLADDAGLAKEFPPERTVGWARYIENARDQVVCNRARCKNAYPELATAEWIPVRADAAYLRPCDQCGTDVLA